MRSQGIEAEISGEVLAACNCSPATPTTPPSTSKTRTTKARSSATWTPKHMLRVWGEYPFRRLEQVQHRPRLHHAKPYAGLRTHLRGGRLHRVERAPGLASHAARSAWRVNANNLFDKRYTSRPTTTARQQQLRRPAQREVQREVHAEVVGRIGRPRAGTMAETRDWRDDGIQFAPRPGFSAKMMARRCAAPHRASASHSSTPSMEQKDKSWVTSVDVAKRAGVSRSPSRARSRPAPAWRPKRGPA